MKRGMIALALALALLNNVHAEIEIVGNYYKTAYYQDFAPVTRYDGMTWATLGTATFGSAGTHTVRLTCTGKSSGSSSYILSVDAVSLMPTDGSAGLRWEAESISPSASGATTSTVTETFATGGTWLQLNASASGNYLQFTTPSVAAGSYNLVISYKADTNRGLYQGRIDSTDIGSPFDEYGSSLKEFDSDDLGVSPDKSVFWDDTSKRLTPLGYYAHRLSAEPDFMIQHLKNILDNDGNWTTRSSGSETIRGNSYSKYSEWSGSTAWDVYWDKTSGSAYQIPYYKAIHRIFKVVATYRWRMRDQSGSTFVPHPHTLYPQGQIWATAMEGFLKSRLVSGRLANADGSKATHLAMQFHLLNTLTNGRFYEDSPNWANWSNPSLVHPLLGIDITNIWNLTDAQNLADQVLTKSSMIEYNSNPTTGFGLWQAVEIMADRPSVHATYDALSILNNLHFNFTVRYLHEASGGAVEWNGSLNGNNTSNYSPTVDPNSANPYLNVVSSSSPYAYGNPGDWIFKKWRDKTSTERGVANNAITKFGTDLWNANSSVPQYCQGTKNDGSGETWSGDLAYSGQPVSATEIYTYGQLSLTEWFGSGVQAWLTYYHN